MKLINADAFIAALESFADRAHGNQHFLNGIKTAKELIAEADEAVVRCGECKYCYFRRGIRALLCRYRESSAIVEAGDYCSRGERRTDETD